MISTWLCDLSNNLVAECIGIIVTVFVINVLLDRREKARWKPAQDRVYKNIVDIVNALFLSMLPPGSVSKYHPWVLSFGTCRAEFAIDPSGRKGVSDSSFWFDAVKWKVNTDGALDETALVVARERIAAVLAESGHLIDASLTAKILQLENLLAGVASRPPRDPSAWRNDAYLIAKATLLQGIASSALETISLLEARAERCLTREQWLSDTFGDTIAQMLRDVDRAQASGGDSRPDQRPNSFGGPPDASPP